MTNFAHQTVRWILDPDVFETYREELAEEIRRQGHDVVFLADLKPGYSFDDDGCSYRKVFSPDQCTIFHGCIELARRISEEGLGVPGVYGTHDRYYCSSYFCPLGRFLLNQQYTMLPLGELTRCRDFLFETLGKNGTLFVRPDSPDKPFAGQLIFSETFDKDVKDLAFYDVPAESLVVVSRPAEIEKEWRFVVVSGELIDGSLYKICGNATIEQGYEQVAWDFGQQIVATNFAPDPVWVFDLCRTSEGEIALLEIGCFSHSDLYACDKSKIVSAVSGAAVQDWGRRTT